MDDFKIIGVFDEYKLVYCLLESNSGDATQIGVDRKYRRNGIGTQLIKEILKYNLHDLVKIINIETECELITGFLQPNSIPLCGKQFEMIKQL